MVRGHGEGGVVMADRDCCVGDGGGVAVTVKAKYILWIVEFPGDDGSYLSEYQLWWS